MSPELDGRIAIVTGASRGIGRQIALTLSRAGASIVAVSRGSGADVTAADIVSAGGTALACGADVTVASDVDVVVRTALERFGRVDILINNAGITRDQLLLRMKRDDWDAVLSTNLTAAFLFTQAVLKPMLKERYGRLIYVGSVVGQMGNAGQANYAATKAGLIGFAKSIAREVASRQVTANVVAPGLIDTDMTRELTKDARHDWEQRIPLGRLGRVEDVAEAVCFLASDKAAYITGQVLAVNGGLYT
ncbi:MAG: 3-oxoacyl-[acyl-carrier-protein] reductase [Vicinamibacterales bacterium]